MLFGGKRNQVKVVRKTLPVNESKTRKGGHFLPTYLVPGLREQLDMVAKERGMPVRRLLLRYVQEGVARDIMSMGEDEDAGGREAEAGGRC